MGDVAQHVVPISRRPLAICHGLLAVLARANGIGQGRRNQRAEPKLQRGVEVPIA
jgi:hypothetical protein